MQGQKQARRCAQSPLGAVALNGVADLLGGGETGPRRAFGIIGARAHLDDHAGTGEAPAFARTQKIAPPGDPRGAIGVSRQVLRRAD